MRNLIWSGLVMMLLLSGCGWSGDATRPNDITPLTSITITAAYSTIAQGTSVKLTATGNYSGLFTRDITDVVHWSSNTLAVANFTPNVLNRVAGLTPGSAVLTATTPGGVSATFNLTVSSATASAVTITPANPSVALGLTQQFTATGAFSDGTTQDITFDATWASSNTAVATVSNAATDNNGGLASPPTNAVPGTTTITATFGAVNGVGGVSDSTVLTVTAPVLQSIAVATSNTFTSVLSMSKVTFTATGSYSNNTTKDITSQVTWNSSNPNVASNPIAGVTQTASQGITTITASLGTVVSSGTTLTVNGGNLVSIPVITNMTVVNGTSIPISVIGTFGNGVTRDITGALTWSVANQSIATVTTVSGNRVLINALAPGTTIITATFPSPPGVTKTSTAFLTVTNPGLSTFTVSPPPSTGLALTAGTSGRLTATATFSDGTNQDVTANVTWGSNAPAIATVDTVGPTGERIIGVATGITTITAAFGNLHLINPVPVSVITRTLRSFTIIPSGTVSVMAGNQTPFTVTATYSDGTTVDITSDVAWATGDGNIAVLADSLNQPGQVVGVSGGTTPLTATFNGQTSTVTLKVQ